MPGLIHDDEDALRHQPHAGRIPTTSDEACSDSDLVLLEEISQWAQQVGDYGWPHFGEFANRVELLRHKLLGACHDPDCCSVPCDGTGCEIVTAQSPAALRERAALRKQLHQELHRIINDLKSEDVKGKSWQDACRTFEGLCCRFRRLIGKPASDTSESRQTSQNVC